MLLPARERAAVAPPPAAPAAPAMPAAPAAAFAGPATRAHELTPAVAYWLVRDRA